MKRYLNISSLAGWIMALMPLLIIAAVSLMWKENAASAGASTEVPLMDREQYGRFETATFSLG